MNGYVRISSDVGEDFAPSARLNSRDSMIGVVSVARGIEVVVYSADEARQYAAAFTEVAGECPSCSVSMISRLWQKP